MKKIIEKKLYDTETAILLHKWGNGIYGTDFHSSKEALYRTPKGAYFVVSTFWAYFDIPEEEGLRVISEAEAIEWLEVHDGTDALIEHFSSSIEEG